MLSAVQTLPEWSEPALRAALRARAPDLADLPLTLSPPLGAPLEIFQRGIAAAGGRYFVKAAWSEAAAAHLLWQARLLRALDGLSLPLQRPVLVTTDPVLLVHRALPGRPLIHERAGSRAGEEIGRLLSIFHDPATRALAEAAGIDLLPAERWSQADVARLRRDLLPRLPSAAAGSLAAALGTVERALSPTETVRRVLVHGDIHGHNLLFDEDGRLTGVLDLESVSLGEAEFDFRYLPAIGAGGAVLQAALAAYPRPLDLARILAWHLLTDLGDALWRTEQGAPVELGPLERRVELALARLSALAGGGWS